MSLVGLAGVFRVWGGLEHPELALGALGAADGLLLADYGAEAGAGQGGLGDCRGAESDRMRRFYLFIIGCVTIPAMMLQVLRHYREHFPWVNTNGFCRYCKSDISDLPLSFKLGIFRRAARMIGYHPGEWVVDSD